METVIRTRPDWRHSPSTGHWVMNRPATRYFPLVTFWRGYYEVWEEHPDGLAGSVKVHSRHVELTDAKDAAEKRAVELDAPAKPVQGRLL